MRDSIHLETLGIPTLTIITSSFDSLARFTSSSSGMPDQCFVVLPHPIGGIAADEVRAKIRRVFPDILDRLTGWKPSTTQLPPARPPYPAEVFSFQGSVSDVQAHFFERELSAGLPFVPPTRELVRKMLRGTSHKADEVVWDGVPPRMGVLTVELVAACAAMAGCKPEYMPLILAIVEALTDPEAHYAHQATTTGTESLMLLVNGPIIKELGLAYGTGAAGLCYQPNASIGYAIGLISKIVGGSKPPDRDKSTLSNPADLLNFVLGENEDENPWEPYSVEQGFGRADNVVTVKVVYPPIDISDHSSVTGEEILNYAARNINQPYTQAMRHKPVLLGWGPEHAATLAKDGFTKKAIKEYLWLNARYPASVYAKAAWEGGMCQPNEDFPDIRYGSQTLLPIVAKAEDIRLIVCGGSGKHSQFWPGPKGIVSRLIDPWR